VALAEMRVRPVPVVQRWQRLVWAIVGFGWLVRVVPLVLHGPARYPIDYDQGVYFTASALLARGHALYADVVFMHPPGLPYVLTVVSWLPSPDVAFGISRVLMTVVGATNILLVCRIAARHAGPLPAIAGGLVYALHPAVVAAERGVFLEPVLNMLCLAAAVRWLGGADDPRHQARAAWVTGALLGCAVVVKLWAAFAVVACLASCRPARWRGDGLRLIAGAAAAVVVLLLPLGLRSLGPLMQQVIVFQLHRPPDGLVSIGDRLRLMFFDPSALVPTAWAVAGLVLVAASGRWSRMARFAAAWYGLTVAGFLVSGSYYGNYNAFLAPAVALLAAVAVKRTRYPLVATWITIGAVLMALFMLDGARQPTGVLDDLAAAGRRQPVDCVLSFEPGWLIAAGDLSDPERVGSLAADPYGAQLNAVVSTGRRYGSAEAAFRDAASELLVWRALAACDAVILGPRGRVQIGDLSERLDREFVQAAGTRPGAPDLWVRRRG
jgi:hypothetical protein